MRSIVVLTAALCAIASACKQSDPTADDLWGRTTEARLSRTTAYTPCAVLSDEARTLPALRCSTKGIETNGGCDPIMSPEDAVRTLALRPACLDYAITALERYQAWTDLSAAYIARARRDDTPFDYLKAVDAAARTKEPRNAATLFNLALAQQNVALTGDAIITWNQYLKADASSGWASEAQRHLERLQRQRDGLEQWAAIKEQLKEAKDESTFARLIDRFPTTAMVYFEELEHPRPAALARALSRRLRDDPWPVALLDNREPAKLLLNRYTTLTSSREMSKLDKFVAEAQLHGYKHLLARCSVLRALIHYEDSLYLDALAELDAAQRQYEALGDEEGIATVQMRRIGFVRALGGAEHAWNEAFKAFPDVAHIGTPRQRHFLHGEIALTALELGHQDIALRHQNLGVRVLDQYGARSQHRAVARRERARIKAGMKDYEGAARDLNESEQLETGKIPPGDRRILRAARAEVEGQSNAHDATAAISYFTEALETTRTDEFPTFRAQLYAQRAQAYYRLNETGKARDDLEQALRILGGEENRLLHGTTREEAEDSWSFYFSRFEDAYELLIHLLMQQGEAERAFFYAERARAFEPLHRVLQSPNVPRAFRNFAARDKTIADLQGELPAGTYIVQYSVQTERTYAWIVSRDTFEAIELPGARREVVEAYTDALLQAARRRDARGFGEALFDPHTSLIAPVMAKVTDAKRIVFVPDGPMLGLPFAALRNQDTRLYLLEEDAVISISPSAALYVWSLMRDADLQPADMFRALLLGNPSFEPFNSLPNLRLLPGAESEVKEIAKIYGGTPLVRDQATASALVSQGHGSAIIHVAAHAIANARAPNQSLILLAKEETHDGRFTASECMNRLKLPHTRLVVLSTCSSASGLSVGPEGIAPLVRPLFAAGVPAVIGSLWDVDDATAKELLVSFHRVHSQGKDAAAAMQEAQGALLNHKTNSRFRPALEWASFQVTGYASAPRQ